MRILPIEIERICRSLKPVIGEQAEAIWLAYLSEDDRGKEEFEQLLPLLAAKLLNKNLSDEKVLLLPPALEKAVGEFPIGRISYNDKEMYPLALRGVDFIKQIGIFSITGAGKTNLGLLLALQLLRKGTPFLIVDWKRQWRNILSVHPEQHPELKNIQIFTIGRATSSFNWNPFRGPPGVHYKTWVSVITEVLEKSHLGGPGVADFFLKIYDKIFQEHGFAEGKETMWPNFFDGLRAMDAEKVIARELLWKQSCGRILRSFTYGPQASCFNARHPIKLEELLDKPVILELDQELPKWLRLFLTELILRFIHLYRLSQGETTKLRHVLFLEEVHNLFPKTWTFQKDTASSSLENVYREIRAFGQGLVSITQHTSLLPIFILGNCHTQITLALQHGDDIEASKKAMFLKFGEDVFLDRLRVGEGIVKIKGRVNPCLVCFPLVPTKIGAVTDDVLRKHMEGSFADSSRNSPKNQVVTRNPGSDIEMSEDGNKLLESVAKNPLIGVAERYRILDMNARRGHAAKEELLSHEFVQPQAIPTPQGRVLLLELTEKGRGCLGRHGQKVVPDNESLEHKYWKARIADYYLKKGCQVEVEKQVNGKPDLIVKNSEGVVAVEIETGKSDPILNIMKNLKHGFPLVITVATSESAEQGILVKLRAAQMAQDPRIRVVSVKAF